MLKVFRPFLRIFLALFLVFCLVVAVIASWRWPLVGDASLMHYVVFLIGKGMVPYRQIFDVNLPGSHFFEMLGMRFFGPGATGWRMYDLLLLAVCILSAFVILPSRDWFAAAFASALFCLFHIEDGIAQLGQRDLLITALLASAYAMERRIVLRRDFLLSSLSGLLIGSTVIIKPLYLPPGLWIAATSAYWLRRRPRKAYITLASFFAGVLAPLLITIIYLHRHSALDAFWTTVTGLIPLHSSLGRKPFSFLAAHCISPIGPLVGLWIVVLAVTRPRFSPLRLQLIVAAAFCLVGYFAQGKGYPYHRYPLLFFLLLLISWDFASASRSPGAARIPAVAGFAFGCLFLAPWSVWKIRSFDPATPFQSALAQELTKLGGSQLSGQVQCLDTFGGCLNTLYHLKITQSSGFLYDCYLFTPSQNQVSLNYRKSFWSAFERNPPRILVLTSQFCFGPDSFDKFHNWPAFDDALHRSYKLVTEWVPDRPQHWWSRKEFPASFRIYVLQAETQS